MATNKTVQIEAKLGEGFTIESKIRDHTVYVDQPTAGGGADAGPTPLEYLLLSLGSCIGSIGRIIANQRKLPLRSMTIGVSGDLDLDFLLGKTDQGRAGFGELKMSVKMDCDMSLEEQKQFLHEVDARCPVSDSLVNGCSVRLEAAE